MEFKSFKLDELKKKLREGVVEVTFTKKDGTERVMKCTLKESLIPEKHKPKGDNPREGGGNPFVIPCYDVEKEGWRSFTFTDVKSVQ
jgi:hypothetical protein